jgi:hypothetical protein
MRVVAPHRGASQAFRRTRGGGAQCRKLRGNGGQVNWLCWLERPPVCGVRGLSPPVLSPSRGTCAAKGYAPAASGHRVRVFFFF